MQNAPLNAEHVVVIGAGFSGTLLAINLLRQDGPRVTLIERRAQPARGAAYSTTQSAHLLNVRASNMSAFPDLPDHFANWFIGQGGRPDGFASRRLYGVYLSELLDAARKGSGERLRIIHEPAVDLSVTDSSATVTLASGAIVHADLAVLALGNLPPTVPPGIDAEALGREIYWSDPWSGGEATGLAEGLGPDDAVMLIGTGLTAVDAMLTLDEAGFSGPIMALSRRGLLPRAHGDGGHAAPRSERPSVVASQLLADVRADAAEHGWRAAVDSLRPHNQGLWQAADEDQRARFLRHLRPWWDVHRHRLAPEVAERIKSMVVRGQLQIIAGSTKASEVRGDGADIKWRRRGSDMIHTSHIRRVVNCTGPGGDLLASRDPLVISMLGKRMIRPDTERLGADVNAQAQVLDADGKPNQRLLALGPMTRGSLWEITAVPDIRRQVWDIGRRLSHAHWVGEGL